MLLHFNNKTITKMSQAIKKTLNNFMAAEPLCAGSLLFTTKSQGVPDTQLIDLERRKAGSTLKEPSGFEPLDWECSTLTIASLLHVLIKSQLCNSQSRIRDTTCGSSICPFQCEEILRILKDLLSWYMFHVIQFRYLIKLQKLSPEFYSCIIF